MKLLTVAVPCYNSEAYMRKCIDALLIGGDEVEVLIIDDGSTKDRTPEIADEYQEKYPSIVRAIHQENKGHGGAVNTGIEHAAGLYYKVCDSDDYLAEEAYLYIMSAIRKMAAGNNCVDVIFSNYTYDKVGKKRKYVMRYDKYFPQDRIFGWDEFKELNWDHYVLMHSVTYRTDFLRSTGLRLPEHTFYVDNIYAYIPFAKVKTMYYCNVDLYMYYIGRADQSVNNSVMLGRLEQQRKVNEIIIDYLGEIRDVPLHPNQRSFMFHAVSIMMMVTSELMIRSGSQEKLEEKKALWQRLKDTDERAYRKIRGSILGRVINLPGRPGRRLVVLGYNVGQKIFGFV